MKRMPILRANFEGELVFDGFAGGGGTSTGLDAALGRPPDFAVNHDPEALAMHEANHPDTRHYCESIWEVDPREITRGRRVGLAWFSPDCFPAGTLVLTREGYRPIEQVAVGDEVLTHLLRWRRVTSTMSAVRPLVRLRGHGHPGLAVSAEHPFYARRRRNVWNNARRGVDRVLDAPDWAPASLLERGWCWATPTDFPLDTPPAIPVHHRRETTITPALMWLVGRYVADGWTRLTDTRAELVITCGKHEVDGLRERLALWPRAGARAGTDELTWHERHTATAYQFTVSHRGLVEWLRQHFGHGAAEKLIPGWALGMDVELRGSLLAGYLSGDGWRGQHKGEIVECNTVSKALAFGVKALAESLGKTVAVYTGRNTNVIQGRQVNALPVWHLRWREKLDKAHRQTWREQGLEWAPIRERVDDVGLAEVFNLSVEEDESYIADSIVVHNCKHFSRAKGGPLARSKEIRSLAWVVIRWASLPNKPRVIIVENVEEFLTWGPLDVDGAPIKDRAGETFNEWLAQLRWCGYEVEVRRLVAADYGSPTTRKRLFIVARSDGAPIVWPEATHGDGRPNPWRPVSEVLNWSDIGPSIFGRKKPLAEATMRRIARGLRKFVLESAKPFVMPGGSALVAPYLIQTSYGERPGQAPRVLDLHRPLGTIVAGGQKHGLVAAFLTKHYGGNESPGSKLDRPIDTITSIDHHALTVAHLDEAPHPELRPFLIKFYGTGAAAAVDEPLDTITTKDRFGLVTVDGSTYCIRDIGMRMLQPRELFRAQGFPEDYVIDPWHNGKTLSKTSQIRLVGNSVPPQLAAALARANGVHA